MPGIIVVSQQETFKAPPMVMDVGPRLKFGSDTEQEVTRDGERKWTVKVAVTYQPQFGRSLSEVIEVTITGGDDPSLRIFPGSGVMFDRLQVGASAPEQRERKDGGTRVVGGKLYWMADGVEPRPEEDGDSRHVMAGATAE